jgi:hypothetical protein
LALAVLVAIVTAWRSIHTWHQSGVVLKVVLTRLPPPDGDRVDGLHLWVANMGRLDTQIGSIWLVLDMKRPSARKAWRFSDADFGEPRPPLTLQAQHNCHWSLPLEKVPYDLIDHAVPWVDRSSKTPMEEEAERFLPPIKVVRVRAMIGVSGHRVEFSNPIGIADHELVHPNRRPQGES